MWFIQLGLRTYFILKPDRFLTTAIFTGSASTVHNSFEIMFQHFTFWCCPGYDTCLSGDYTRSRITLTVSLCTNMEKYAKYHSCNNIEKYANAIRVSYPDRIYREIREHNSRISLASMEHIEKYANTIRVFH